MIAVIFEVKPAKGARQDYLNVAAQLRPMLKQIDGFISVERFQSLSDPGKLLSLSFIQVEEAVKAWRMLYAHRNAQQRGRCEIFEEYRLCVATVMRSYAMPDRKQAPVDSQEIHDK